MELMDQPRLQSKFKIIEISFTGQTCVPPQVQSVSVIDKLGKGEITIIACRVRLHSGHNVVSVAILPLSLWLSC